MKCISMKVSIIARHVSLASISLYILIIRAACYWWLLRMDLLTPLVCEAVTGRDKRLRNLHLRLHMLLMSELLLVKFKFLCIVESLSFLWAALHTHHIVCVSCFLLHSTKSALIVVKFLIRYCESPINHADVEPLKLIDVVEGDATDRSNVLVRVVGVIVHFGDKEHTRENQPKHQKWLTNIRKSF